MLDWPEISRQIADMLREREAGGRKLLGRASRASGVWAEVRERLGALDMKAELSRTSWPVARPLGDGGEPPERPAQVSVLAADGSQIYPDRHEVASCYLIHIGRVALHYGTGERPLLEGRPHLFFREEDFQPGGRPLSQEAVSILRSVMEREALAEMAGALPPERAMVALVDGPLGIWGVDQVPAWRARLDMAMGRLRELKVPVAGYVSHPGGQEVVGLLKLALCPEEAPDCGSCPRLEGPPCGEVDGVPDRLVFGRALRPKERSAAFRTEGVGFFYLDTGWEVARVEVPIWVAEDPALLAFVHACLLDQVEKGRGYPVALSEAHEQAAVRGRDREQFYRMVEEALVRGGIKAERSRKGVSKRRVGGG
ncbi:MAG TPA: DNA double-strand break repair nuclease NurA [Candidatus Latescibacteria bacterium]|nr:DNA double-strand break repair nuclease NurA [Candidatus Latescibacterota bacterium]